MKKKAIIFIFLVLKVLVFAEEYLHLKAIINSNDVAFLFGTDFDIELLDDKGLLAVHRKIETVQFDYDGKVVAESVFFINVSTGTVKDGFIYVYGNEHNELIAGDMENGEFVFYDITRGRDKITVNKKIYYSWETNTYRVVDEQNSNLDITNLLSQRKINSKYQINKGEQIIKGFYPKYITDAGFCYYTIKINEKILPYSIVTSQINPIEKIKFSLGEKYLAFEADIFQDYVLKDIPKTIKKEFYSTTWDAEESLKPKDRINGVYLVYAICNYSDGKEGLTTLFDLSFGSYFPPSQDGVFYFENVSNRKVVMSSFDASFMDLHLDKPTIWGTPIEISYNTSILEKPVENAAVVKVIDRNYYEDGFVSGIVAEKLTTIEKIGDKIGVWYKLMDTEADSGWIFGTSSWKVKNKADAYIMLLNGVVNDDRVRVRGEPNLQSQTLRHVNIGDKIKIIDLSYEKQKIDDMEAYWYKVELTDGKIGWVYGAYVDVE